LAERLTFNEIVALCPGVIPVLVAVEGVQLTLTPLGTPLMPMTTGPGWPFRPVTLAVTVPLEPRSMDIVVGLTDTVKSITLSPTVVEREI